MSDIVCSTYDILYDIAETMDIVVFGTVLAIWAYDIVYDIVRLTYDIVYDVDKNIDIVYDIAQYIYIFLEIVYDMQMEH
jgi:hypothetical protein